MKGLAYEAVPINLLTGAQRSAAFLAPNPPVLVPARELDNGAVLTQSLSILDWLERSYPTPPLLPADAVARAQEMAAGMAIAVDTHPVQNVCFVNYLKSAYGSDTQGPPSGSVTGWTAAPTPVFPLAISPDMPTSARPCQALPAFDAARRKNQPDAT